MITAEYVRERQAEKRLLQDKQHHDTLVTIHFRCRLSKLELHLRDPNFTRDKWSEACSSDYAVELDVKQKFEELGFVVHIKHGFMSIEW